MYILYPIITMDISGLGPRPEQPAPSPRLWPSDRDNQCSYFSPMFFTKLRSRCSFLQMSGNFLHCEHNDPSGVGTGSQARLSSTLCLGGRDHPICPGAVELGFWYGEQYLHVPRRHSWILRIFSPVLSFLVRFLRHIIGDDGESRTISIRCKTMRPAPLDPA